jgi:molecular chaperone DnaK
VYQQAAGAEGSAPGGNGASADAGSSSSDDVIDAEFTESK